MRQEPLHPHAPKRKGPLFPHRPKGQTGLSEAEIIALSKTWLEQGANKFQIRPPDVRISTEVKVIEFDHISYSIVIAPHPLIETVKAHAGALPALRYGVAHEFGHAVMLNRYGLTRYIEMLKSEYAQAEKYADDIAEQLTGMTGMEAWYILERYLPWGADAGNQAHLRRTT